MVQAYADVKMPFCVDGKKALEPVNQGSLHIPVINSFVISPYSVYKKMTSGKRNCPGLEHKFVSRHSPGVVAFDDVTFVHAQRAHRPVGAKELPVVVHHPDICTQNLPAHAGIQFIHHRM